MLVVTKEVAIDRPLDLVCAQFGDVAYHARSSVHRGVSFSVIDDTDEQCDYEQVTRVGPAKLRQSFRLVRGDPAHQVNTITAGAFAPGSITFDIAADDDKTVVTATLRAPLRGLSARLSPLLRPMLARSLAKALEEDRRDLESGNFRSVSG